MRIDARRAWAAAVVLLLLWALVPVRQAGAAVVVGMNMSRHTYYSSDWAFADAFKHGGTWSQRGTIYPQLYVDANGWPLLQSGQAAQSLVFSAIGGHYPAGSWKLTYDGEGSFLFYYDCVKTDEGPGYVNLSVAPTNLGMLIQVATSNPANPVKNMKLLYNNLPAGYTGTFHPKFLDTVRPFAMLRFMEWQMINYAYPTTWSQRTSPNWYVQTDKWGVALEYMIQLCNETNSDMWLCIPHTADDNYITQMATLVLNTFRTDRKVYVEWTNEAWNAGYQQGQWCIQQANLRGLNYAQVMGDEAARTFALWSKVFKGKNNKRLVRVASTPRGPRRPIRRWARSTPRCSTACRPRTSTSNTSTPTTSSKSPRSTAPLATSSTRTSRGPASRSTTR